VQRRRTCSRGRQWEVRDATMKSYEGVYGRRSHQARTARWTWWLGWALYIDSDILFSSTSWLNFTLGTFVSPVHNSNILPLTRFIPCNYPALGDGQRQCRAVACIIMSDDDYEIKSYCSIFGMLYLRRLQMQHFFSKKPVETRLCVRATFLPNATLFSPFHVVSRL
jgi:hypothetical protein